MAKEITDNTSNYTGSASSNTPEKTSNPSDKNPASLNPRPETRPTDNDEISLKELILKLQDWWRYLLSKWLIILIVGLIGGGLGLLKSLSIKPTYIAALTFVLEEEGGKGGLGSLGGLAAMAGINIGGGGGGIFQGDNIFELYKSRLMLTNTLLSSSEENDSLLIDRYIAFNELREGWEGEPKLENIVFSVPQIDFSLQHDSLIDIFVRNIRENYLQVKKPDQLLSLIEVELSTPNER